MRLTRLFVTGVAAAALLVSAAPAGATGNPSPSTCPPGTPGDTWPAKAQGAPGSSPGVAVWHDSTGWHVRVTHNRLRDKVFSGEVATTGELVDVHAVRLERNDSVKVGAGKHTIRFRFNNYGGIDGFDFRTKCAPALAFGFVADGHRVPLARIAIGATARHPGQNPFVLKK